MRIHLMTTLGTVYHSGRELGEEDWEAAEEVCSEFTESSYINLHLGETNMYFNPAHVIAMWIE